MFINSEKYKFSRGFSLLEILISLTVMSFFTIAITQFMFAVNDSTSRNIVKSQLLSELRNLTKSLEEEILPAVSVLQSHDFNGDGTIDPVSETSGKNVLIFTVPVKNAAGSQLYGSDTDGDGIAELITDTVRIMKVNDGTAITARGNGLKYSRLKITVDANPQSRRKSKSQQINIQNMPMYSYLIPHDTTNYEYNFPDNLNIGAVPLFEYYNSSNSSLNSSYDTASGIKVNLWSEREYKKQILTANKSLDIKFRNFINN